MSSRKYGIRDSFWKYILIVGYRPNEEIPYWINAADVVVAPNSANPKTPQDAAAIRWTSPMKIFEYMAACRPIVASDIPADQRDYKREKYYTISRTR